MGENDDKKRRERQREEATLMKKGDRERGGERIYRRGEKENSLTGSYRVVRHLEKYVARGGIVPGTSDSYDVTHSAIDT